MIIHYLPRPDPFTYPPGEVSLRLKEGREAVTVPDVWRDCGLKGPDRPSIRGGGASPDRG